MALKKNFSKLMNNAVFGKTFENVRKQRGIKLVATNKKRSLLVSKPNYHTAKCFSESFFSNRNTENKNKNEQDSIFMLFDLRN